MAWGDFSWDFVHRETANVYDRDKDTSRDSVAFRQVKTPTVGDVTLGESQDFPRLFNL